MTVGVIVGGSSARDALEMDRQLTCCMSDVESRSASVLRALYARLAAYSMVP